MKKLLSFVVVVLCGWMSFAFGLDVERAELSVVRIVVLGKNDGLGTGSGFVVATGAKVSIVATNWHVMEGRNTADSFLVLRKQNERVEVYEGTVLYEDAHRDVALLAIDGLSATPFALLESEPAKGEEVFALGFPAVADGAFDWGELAKGLQKMTGTVVPDPTGKVGNFAEATLSKGAVRRVVWEKWDPQSPIPDFLVVESDLNMTPGNSGGPLLNDAGAVVGLNTQRVPDKNSPIDVVRKSSHSSVVIDAMRKNGIQPTVASGLSGGSMGGGQSWVLWAVVFGLVVAGGATFFMMRRPAAVPAGMPGQFRQVGGPPPFRGVPTPLPMPLGGGGGVREMRWVFEGNNTEPGQVKDFRFELTAPMLVKGKVIVGRKRDAVHVFIPNGSISSQHASFFLSNNELCIEDRNSSNGTRVNGVKLAPFKAHPVKNGDRIGLGEVQIRVGGGGK